MSSASVIQWGRPFAEQLVGEYCGTFWPSRIVSRGGSASLQDNRQRCCPRCRVLVSGAWHCSFSKARLFSSTARLLRPQLFLVLFLAAQQVMADHPPRVLLSDMWVDSSSDEGRSSIDAAGEALDAARARAGGRFAAARVVPRIVRRTIRCARRRRRAAAAAVLSANREAVRRDQQDAHLWTRFHGAVAPVEGFHDPQNAAVLVECGNAAPRRPSPKKPRLSEFSSSLEAPAAGAGAAGARATPREAAEAVLSATMQPTILPAVRPPPRMTAYVTVRQSWRRVEAPLTGFYVPYLGTSPYWMGATARLIDENKDASAVSSDGSDASGDEVSRGKSVYYSLAARTQRSMDREALSAVVAQLGVGAAVLRVLRRVLRVRRSAVRRMLRQLDTRPAAANAVRAARAKSAARWLALDGLTGGANLAAVLAGGAIAEVPESPSALPGSTASHTPAHRRRHTTASASACHRAAGPRLRDGVAAARRVKTALRVRGADALPAVSALFGTLLGCRPAARAGAVGLPIVGAGAFPLPAESPVPPRDALLRHFCRLCFVYCCRIHGVLTRDGLIGSLPVTPVMSPSDPRRLATEQEGGACVRDPHGAFTAGGAGGGHPRTSGGVNADGAPSIVADGARSDKGGRARRSDAVDADGAAVGRVSSTGQARRARAMHEAISLAAGPCSDCRLGLRSRAAVFVRGCRTEVLSVDDIELLRTAVRIVGRFDTCRMARFVPNTTCVRVAEYLVGWGWPDAWPGDRPTPQPPERDAPISQPPELSLTNSSQEAVVKKAPPFVPCGHLGACTMSNCRCVQADVACEKQCGCGRTRWASSAPVVLPHDNPAVLSIPAEGCRPTDGSLFCSRRISCSCLPPSRCETDSCPCFAADRECDPDGCMMCGAHLHPASGVDGVTTGFLSAESVVARTTAAATGAYWRLVRPPHRSAPGIVSQRADSAPTDTPQRLLTRRCRNVQVQVGARVRLVLGVSRAHGLGVFVAEAAGAGDFVTEYVGELVPPAEGHLRGRLYDALGVSYLASASQSTVVDATRVGSRAKFINHSSDSPNLQMKLLSIGGTIRVALFAVRDLVVGEEVFFDYGYALDTWEAAGLGESV